MRWFILYLFYFLCFWLRFMTPCGDLFYITIFQIQFHYWTTNHILLNYSHIRPPKGRFILNYCIPHLKKMLLFQWRTLHQHQGRKPHHTVSITTDTGKTAALTHSRTLCEFITLNPIGKLKVLCRKYLGSLTS